MDIQQYISSGIIEAYVLGIADEEEVRELELLSAQHEEIAAAIASYKNDLEEYGTLHAIPPPPDLKDKIWSVIESEQRHPFGKSNLTLTEQPASNVVTHLETANRGKANNNRTAIAAAVILLIGSIVLNFVFWNKSKSTEEELAFVKTEQEKAIAASRQMQQELTASNNSLKMVMDPAMKSIPLAGVGEHTDNNATVIWDTRSKEVYLSMNNLPPAPEGKQYQLWAIVDGKPVDLGVFPKDKQEVMQKMKVIPAAQMFAITLEKEGGSEGPTLEQMYVAGKV